MALETPKTITRDYNNLTLQKFEANEHKHLGDKAFTRIFEDEENKDLKYFLMEKGKLNISHNFINLTEAVSLTAGEWVALAGDFYGIPEAPISGLPEEGELEEAEQNARFSAAYELLANIKSGSNEEKELKALLRIVREEEHIVTEAMRADENVATAVHETSGERDAKFAAATASSSASSKAVAKAHRTLKKLMIHHLPIIPAELVLYSRYMELAVNNYDHFSDDAAIAYAAGHRVSMITAARARRELKNGNKDAARDLLLYALTQELFACHFLTDLFAAGHMRVPRKKLGKLLGKRRGGLLSLMMHNEDGDRGLQVKGQSRFSRAWQAKGDGCLYELSTDTNREYAIKAVIAALQSVLDHYQSPDKGLEFDFKCYLPKPHSDPKHQNHLPLCRIVEDGNAVEVQNRKVAIEERSEATYETHTKSSITPLLVQMAIFDHKHRHHHGEEIKVTEELTEAEVEELLVEPKDSSHCVIA